MGPILEKLVQAARNELYCDVINTTVSFHSLNSFISFCTACDDGRDKMRVRECGTRGLG